MPLVVPEINADQIPTEPSILAWPNCSTIGVVQALAPIQAAGELKQVAITTLQAASRSGRDGIDELRQQRAAVAQGEEPGLAQVFAAQLVDHVAARSSTPQEVADNVRKGAATNAVQTAESWLARSARTSDGSA